MGCVMGTKGKVVKPTGGGGGGKIQDEARSYRSKVGAMRLVLKNEETRHVFRRFIENEGNTDGRSEFVTYFETLDECKQLPLDEVKVRLKKLLGLTPIPPDSASVSKMERNAINSTLWSCLRPLRPLNLEKATQVEIIKAIGATQDLLLSPVTPEFERFMDSPQFEECKKKHLDQKGTKQDGRSPRNKHKDSLLLHKRPIIPGAATSNAAKAQNGASNKNENGSNNPAATASSLISNKSTIVPPKEATSSDFLNVGVGQ